jgi:hypothetical protein
MAGAVNDVTERIDQLSPDAGQAVSVARLPDWRRGGTVAAGHSRWRHVQISCNLASYERDSGKVRYIAKIGDELCRRARTAERETRCVNVRCPSRAVAPCTGERPHDGRAGLLAGGGAMTLLVVPRWASYPSPRRLTLVSITGMEMVEKQNVYCYRESPS